MQTAELKIKSIARKIFTQIRTTIVMKMRFLDMAVFRLHLTPEKLTLATDGDRLYYQPVWLLKRYREDSNALTRDYMHVLLHCIFRHPFVNTLIDQPLWNLACDIAVEAMICDFQQPHFATKSEALRKSVVDLLRGEVKPLTAEKLYRYFQDHPPRSDWPRLFYADDHDLWYQREKAVQMAKQARAKDVQGQNRNKDNPDTQDDRERSPHGPRGEKNQTNGQASPQPDQQDLPGQPEGEQAGDPSSGVPYGQQLEDEWQDISEHVQMDMETFAKAQGTRAGSMQQMLAELNRERYNYEAFLKKFAVLGEAMKINDDEFDYIFYTYGLKLYKNMPLIEPLEYKEVRRIREFVIAIDTSGSTSGELVQKFLTKTYNILMSTESFFSKVNLHILQCDAEIQEVVKITKQDEFDDYLANMTIRGLGGTDFRPVFGYVDQMIRQHEFKHLKGLIYFTDGCGTFPEHKPVYTTAFVFVQDAFNNLDVPPWAIKLILEKDEI